MKDGLNGRRSQWNLFILPKGVNKFNQKLQTEYPAFKNFNQSSKLSRKPSMLSYLAKLNPSLAQLNPSLSLFLMLRLDV